MPSKKARFLRPEDAEVILKSCRGERFQIWIIDEEGGHDQFVARWSMQYHESVRLDRKPTEVEFVLHDVDADRDVIVDMRRIRRIETTFEIYKPDRLESNKELDELDDEMNDLFW